MKQFLKKRWHGIPVAVVSAMLVLALVAGGAFAAYTFFEADVSVQVQEAIVLGVWNPDNPEDSGWDNLEPYGSVDDVEITYGEDSITITTISGYGGVGLTANESIVIPVNIRSGSDGSLSLSASVTIGAEPPGGNLALEGSFEENVGECTGPLPAGHEPAEGCWARNFTAVGPWVSLDIWTGTIAPHGGWSGSAVQGAQVLFIKFSAPEDVVPGSYTFSITLGRG